MIKKQIYSVLIYFLNYLSVLKCHYNIFENVNCLSRNSRGFYKQVVSLVISNIQQIIR